MMMHKLTKEREMFTNTNCHDDKPSYFDFERRDREVVAA